ncbi:MAG: hypothetical protein AAGF23_14340 [Acidobacteriota bacterium]
MSHHEWPGNVRELQHVVQRAVVLAGNRRSIDWDESYLAPSRPPTTSCRSFKQAKARVVARFERSYVETMLAANGGNISRAARTAQKNRHAFWELIRKHQIDVQRFASM